MNLYPDGRVYAEVTIEAMDPPDPAAEFEISVDGRKTWEATVREGDTLRVLLAGPDADEHADAIVVTGSPVVYVRLVDNPEVEIADVGRVIVLDR